MRYVLSLCVLFLPLALTAQSCDFTVYDFSGTYQGFITWPEHRSVIVEVSQEGAALSGKIGIQPFWENDPAGFKYYVAFYPESSVGPGGGVTLRFYAWVTYYRLVGQIWGGRVQGDVWKETPQGFERLGVFELWK